MQDFALSQAIDIWWRAVFACNAYIDTQAPWTLRKTDPQRMEAVLSTLYEAIGTLAIAIQPIIPASAGALLDKMGIPEHQRNFEAINVGDWYAKLCRSGRSEEQTSELKSLNRTSYAVFCLKKKNKKHDE